MALLILLGAGAAIAGENWVSLRFGTDHLRAVRACVYICIHLP